MKIGIVLSNPPGYSETFFTSKIKGLQDNGFEVVLFVQNKPKSVPSLKRRIERSRNEVRGMSGKLSSTNLGVNIYRAPKAYPNYPIIQTLLTIKVVLTLLPHLKKVLKFVKLERNENTSYLQILKKIYLNSHILKQKVDWLHFGFATQALGSELVAKAIGAKMAVSFRGFDINVYPIKFPNCYKNVWKNVDKVHSISNYLLEKAYSLGLQREVSFKIITPAVNIKEIQKSKSQIPTSDKGTVKIVTISRLNWIKGVDVAIDAMKILKEQNIDFTYHLIGSNNKGGEERYKFQVHQLGLKENVIFEGKRSHQETLQLLNEAAIYVQPSNNEGFCNAVLEAQAIGKLCIVNNVGGLPENIQNNKTGWLVPKSNPEALANKIIEVIHLPEEEKQLVSKNAQQRVKDYFTVEQQQKAFVEFYNSFKL